MDKHNNTRTVIVLLALVIALTLLTANHNNGITGMAVQQITVNQTFAQSTTLSLNYSNITSIKASGTTIDGAARIYYQLDNGSLLTVLDAAGNSTFTDSCVDSCNLAPSNGNLIILLRDNATLNLNSLSIETQPLLGIVQQITQLPNINLSNSTTINLSSYFIETAGAPIIYSADIPTGVRSVLFSDVLFLSERDTGEFNATVTASNGQMNVSSVFKIFVAQTTTTANTTNATTSTTVPAFSAAPFSTQSGPQFSTSALTVTACGTINESATLTQNIAGTTSKACFDFNQSNILFDCAGFNITSNPEGLMGINITSFIAVATPISLSNITIQNCNIFNFSIGINISSAVNISLLGNNITNVTDGIWLNNTAGSVLNNNLANATAGRGLYLSNSSNNTINLGNFSANAGIFSSLNGIYLLSSNKNVLNNNKATTGTSHAIYLNSSSNNNITNNVGTASDVAGIDLLTSSNNTLTNNTGTSTNYAIFLESSSNNNILTNNTGTAIGGDGITLSLSSNNTLTGNVGTAIINGITIGLSSNNILTGNVGTASDKKAIYISRSSNNTLLNNTFQSNKTVVYIELSGNNNNFTNTTVIGNTGFEINSSTNNTITMTSFQNTNWSIRTDLGSNLTLVDNERMTNYSFNNTPSLTITSTGIASVNFFNIINANGTNLSMDVNLTGNKIQVNSSRSLGLNTTANITIFSANYATIQVAYDDINFANCPPDVCSPITLSSGNTIFNVSHFTTFQGAGVAVTGCRTVNESLTLTQNIAGTTTKACFDFNQSNILFDCAGYNITSNPQGLMGINITSFIAVATPISLSNITIQNCNIMNFSVGINISSAVNISLFNNNITNVTTGIQLNNTATSVISGNLGNATAGYGLYLTNSSNNTINLGNFSANAGTSSLNGIYLLSSNKNVLNNNKGSTATSYAILLSSSSNNTLTNNIGTANNNAIQLDTSSNNTLTNNTGTALSGGLIINTNSNKNILTNNTGTSSTSNGIYIFASSNNTLTNNIGIASADNGINLEAGSNNNVLNNNTGQATNNGIYLTSSSNNILTNNIGTANSNYGIYISASSNNILINNTGTANNYGAYIFSNSKNNILLNNTFQTNKTSTYVQTTSNNNTFTNTTVIGNTGFEINASTVIIITNTSFQNTNWSIKTGLGSNISLVDNERMTNYSFNNTKSVTITKTGIASVNFFNIINANGTNLSMDVNLTTNRIHVNSSRSPGLNTTANITLFNANYSAVQVAYDDINFANCPPDVCSSPVFVGNDTLFNVSHFTTFQGITAAQGGLITSCRTINESGTLANNVSATGGTCFDLNASNILLNCAGYNITSNPAGIAGINITTFTIGTSQFNLSNITIENCNIFNFSVGINVSSAVNISLLNNNITNVTTGIQLNNTATSVISGNLGNATAGYGLYLTNSSNNTLNLGNFSANAGASSLYGIYLLSSNKNVLNNNIGSTANNFAIYLASSSNGNNLTGNTGTAAGTDGISLSASSTNTLTNNTGTATDVEGIHLASSSNNNILTNNTGTSSSQYGIILESSSNNNLTGNIGTAVSNYGIFLSLSSNNNILTSNIGNSSNQGGISLQTTSNNNLLINNTGTGNNGLGIYLSSSSNNILTNNTGSGRNSDYGIVLLSSSNNNLTGNTGTTTNYGLAIISSSSNNILFNNTFQANTTAVFIQTTSNNNNLTNTTVIGNTGFEVNQSTGIIITNSSFQLTNYSIKTAKGANISLIDNQRMTNYSFNNTPSLTITKTGIASVNFFNIINANGTNLSMDVNLTTNRIHVNTSRSSGLNVTANLTLFNNTAERIQVAYDDINFANCPPDVCSPITLSAGNILFNVSHFTTFQGAQNVSITACRTINESGKLANNVSTNGGTCFDINASNIVLDCGGWNITSNPAGIAGINITTFTIGTSQFNLSNITIENCNIFNFSVGINVSSAVNISLLNNNITNVTTGIQLNNTATSIISGNLGNATAGYGLYLTNSSNNTINLGNFSANAGASSLYGIYLLSSNNNVLNNNVGSTAKINAIFLSSSSNNILTNNKGTADTDDGINLGSSSNNNILTNNTGTANANYGIILVSSSNNTLTNNTGTANSNGIRLASNSNNNILTNNNGTATNFGIILVSSSNNTLTNNTGTANTNYGIYIQLSSNNNLTGNTGTANTNYGIYLTSSSNNNLTGNTGTANTNYGLYISSSANNSRFLNNTFKANITAVYILTRSNNNNFTNTTVIGNTGFEINASTNILITNTSFQNTNWSIRTGLGTNLSLIDNERMTNYSFNNTPSLTITTTGIASINFFNIINANGTNLSMDVNLTTNRIHVNSSRSSGLNVSANITLFNVNYSTIQVAYDDINFVNCPPDVCSPPTSVGSDTLFNVSHFTTFRGTSLTVGDALILFNKTSNPNPITIGQNLNYVLTINNSGNSTAENVTVIETYPTSMAFFSSSPTATQGNNVWALGNISNGTQTTINIVLTVGNGAGNITNFANLSYNNASGAFITINISQNTTVNEPPSPLQPNGGPATKTQPTPPAPPAAPAAPAAPTAPAAISAARMELKSKSVPIAQVACADLNQNISLKAIENFTFDLPASYELATKPLRLTCNNGNTELTLNLPDTFTDLRAWRCEGSYCSNIVDTKVSRDEILCKAQKRLSIPKLIDITPLISKGKVITSTNRSIQTDGIKVEFTGSLPTLAADLSPPDFTPLPNEGLSIIGAPVKIKVKAEDQRVLPAIITIPYPAPENIESNTPAIYQKVGNEWQKIGGTYDAINKKITLNTSNIHSLLDEKDQTTLAILGVTCTTCSASELRKEYDPGSRNVVILVHGLLNDPDPWAAVINEYANTGLPMQVWTLNYPSTTTVEKTSQEFANALELHSSEVDNIYIVGYSLGGFISQDMLERAAFGDKQYSFINKVRKVILIGSPNDGTPAIDIYKNYFTFLKNNPDAKGIFNIDSKVIRELTTGIQRKKVPGIQYYVIAGNQPYAFNLGFFTVKTSELLNFTLPNDGITTTLGAEHIGGEYINNTCKDYYELNLTHTDLNYHPLARRIISRILTADLASTEPKPGYNQYLQLKISDCKPTETIIVAGKPIKEAQAPVPLHCGCGNGVCAIDETELTCPQDCAPKVKTYENTCILLPFGIYGLLLLTGALVSAYLLYSYLHGSHKKPIVQIISIILVAATVSVNVYQNIICKSPVIITYLLIAILAALIVFDILTGRKSVHKTVRNVSEVQRLRSRLKDLSAPKHGPAEIAREIIEKLADALNAAVRICVGSLYEVCRLPFEVLQDIKLFARSRANKKEDAVAKMHANALKESRALLAQIELETNAQKTKTTPTLLQKLHSAFSRSAQIIDEMIDSCVRFAKYALRRHAHIDDRESAKLYNEENQKILHDTRKDLDQLKKDLIKSRHFTKPLEPAHKILAGSEAINQLTPIRNESWLDRLFSKKQDTSKSYAEIKTLKNELKELRQDLTRATRAPQLRKPVSFEEINLKLAEMDNISSQNYDGKQTRKSKMQNKQ